MPVTLEDADIDEAPLEDDEKDGDGVFGPVREDVILTVGLLDDDVDAEALGEKARVWTDVIVTDALRSELEKQSQTATRRSMSSETSRFSENASESQKQSRNEKPTDSR